MRIHIHLNPKKHNHHKEIMEAIENRDTTIFQTKSAYIIHIMTEGIKSINKLKNNETSNEKIIHNDDINKKTNNEDNEFELNNKTEEDNENIEEESYENYEVDESDFNFDDYL